MNKRNLRKLLLLDAEWWSIAEPVYQPEASDLMHLMADFDDLFLDRIEYVWDEWLVEGDNAVRFSHIDDRQNLYCFFNLLIREAIK